MELVIGIALGLIIGYVFSKYPWFKKLEDKVADESTVIKNILDKNN